MNSKSKRITTIVITIGIVALLNILAFKYFFRIDLTEDKRYTLSEATKDIIHSLEEPVTIKAYFSSNLPPQLDLIKRDFKDLLMEYSQASNGMVVYEFIDPLENEETEIQAQENGVPPMQVYVREENQMKQQKAYFGAVIELGEGNEILPSINTVDGMEYALTTSIKKLSVTNKPMVAYITGHGEPQLNSLMYAMRELDVLYRVEPISLSDSSVMLDKYKTVALIGPTDSIPSYQLNRLKNYIDNGGNLLVALNRVNIEQMQGYNMGTSINTGVEGWLNEFGILVDENFVLDANAVSVMAQGQVGNQRIFQQILFPYIPKIINFADHPISKGLEMVVLNYVSSVNYVGDSTLKFTPLLKSGDLTTTKPATSFIDISHEWDESDFPVSNITLGGTLEGVIGSKNTKIVVLGDADFAVVNDQQQQQVNPDNISLLVNSIDWLSDDTGLIELRTQGATARPIDEMEDGKKNFLKFLNFLIPILLAIIYGIVRFQRNRILRLRRKEIGYV